MGAATTAIFTGAPVGEKFKMPPLYEKKVEQWLAKFENRCEVCVPQINSDSAKYKQLYSLLPTRVVDEVYPLLTKLDANPAAGNRYKQLKEGVLESFGF